MELPAGTVGGLLNWSRNIEVGYIPSTYHILPQGTISISKSSAGNGTFTVTLCRKGTTNAIKPYAFRLISLPTLATRHTQAGFVDIVYNTRMEASFLCNNECGNISNVREITYNGSNYIACDVLVNQYGSNKLYVVGIHNDLSEVMDVTGNFSELE